MVVMGIMVQCTAIETRVGGAGQRLIMYKMVVYAPEGPAWNLQMDKSRRCLDWQSMMLASHSTPGMPAEPMEARKGQGERDLEVTG